MVNNPFSYLGAPFQGVPPEFRETQKKKPAGVDHIHAFGLRIAVPRKQPEAVVAHIASSAQAKAKAVLTQSPPAPPPAPLSEAARLRKSATQRPLTSSTPAQATLATQKGFAAAVRSPTPPAPPRLSPEQQQRADQRKALEALDPKLRADLVRSLKLANTPDAEMPDGLLQSLSEIDGKMPVVVHAHMRDHAKTETGLYRDVYNGVNGSQIKADKNKKLPRDWPSVGNTEVGQIIDTAGFYGTATSPSTNVESIGLRAAAGGTRLLVYRYSGNSYIDTEKRPKCTYCIGIELPAKKAEAVFKLLKQHPEEARAYFICAGQHVSEAEYLWEKRRPPYEVSDSERRMVYVDTALHDTMGKPLNAVDTQVLELTHMVKEGGTWSEKEFPEVILKHQECNPKRLKSEALRRARSQPTQKPRR